MKSAISEKYIELAFRYMAALYQDSLELVCAGLKEKVKLESYSNPDANTRRKYYVDKMYHSLVAATRAKLARVAGLINTRVVVRRFKGYSIAPEVGPSTARVLYYVSQIPAQLATSYAKYIALIWVMKSKKFANRLAKFGEDIKYPAIFTSSHYTFYEGQLSDFIRIPFRKINGRSRYRQFQSNTYGFDRLLKTMSYFTGTPADTATGVWKAPKSLNIPLYVPMPAGYTDTSANAIHLGHNTKTVGSLLGMLRLMNALDPAGPSKLLGSKKMDLGQAVAHQAVSTIFTAPLLEAWLTSCPTYCPTKDNDLIFESRMDITGFLLGDYPFASPAGSLKFEPSTPNDAINYEPVSKALVRHSLIRRGLDSKDPAVITEWLKQSRVPGDAWLVSIAENYFATFKSGLQGIEMGTDPGFWLKRTATNNQSYDYDYASGSRVCDTARPEPFCLSYLAKTVAFNTAMTTEATEELKPVLSPSAVSDNTRSVKQAINLFPNHLIREILMAEDMGSVVGFEFSEEPTEEEVTRLAEYIQSQVSYVTVQYEPVLNMVGSLSTALDGEMDHLSAYTKFSLMMREHKRYLRLPLDLRNLPAQVTTSDISTVSAAGEDRASWLKAVDYAGQGVGFAFSNNKMLDELLESKIQAAINLKNFEGKIVAPAEPELVETPVPTIGEVVRSAAEATSHLHVRLDELGNFIYTNRDGSTYNRPPVMRTQQ